MPQLSRAARCIPRDEICEAVQVGGHKVGGSADQLLLPEHGADRLPPSTRQLCIADVSSAKQTDHEVLLSFRQSPQRWPEPAAQGVAKAHPVVEGDTKTDPDPVDVRLVGLQV